MKLIKRNHCPFCKNLKSNTLYKEKFSSEKIQKFLYEYYKISFSSLKNSNYQLEECEECYGIFQLNIPDNNFINYLYDELINQEQSLEKQKNMELRNFRVYFEDAKFLTNYFNKKQKDISILEFGCGFGSWALYMKSLKFDIKVSELSEHRIKFLKKENIEILNTFSNNKFDCIYSNQVLEHVENPLDVLNNLKKMLKKNGIMIHKVPSSFLFKKRLSKNYYAQKDCAHPLEHINIFNKNSIKKISQILQMKIIHNTFSYNKSYYSLLKDIKNIFYFDRIILKNEE